MADTPTPSSSFPPDWTVPPEGDRPAGAQPASIPEAVAAVTPAGWQPPPNFLPPNYGPLGAAYGQLPDQQQSIAPQPESRGYLPIEQAELVAARHEIERLQRELEAVRRRAKASIQVLADAAFEGELPRIQFVRELPPTIEDLIRGENAVQAGGPF